MMITIEDKQWSKAKAKSMSQKTPMKMATVANSIKECKRCPIRKIKTKNERIMTIGQAVIVQRLILQHHFRNQIYYYLKIKFNYNSKN